MDALLDALFRMAPRFRRVRSRLAWYGWHYRQSAGLTDDTVTGTGIPEGLIPHLIIFSLPIIGVLGCIVFAAIEWRNRR